MSKPLAPQVTRSYPGRLNDARSAMEKEAKQLAKDGYELTAEAWEPSNESKDSKHKQHGILWKMTHPVGATLGAARFVGATAISALSPNDRGTLTVTFQRSEQSE